MHCTNGPPADKRGRRHPRLVAGHTPDPLDVFLRQFRPHCGMPHEFLLSRAALESLPSLYSQEQGKDPLVPVKFFTPDAPWSWFATEANVERDESGAILDVTFFGFVVGLFSELGYFSLIELASTPGPLGLPVERDLYWTPRHLSDVQAEASR